MIRRYKSACCPDANGRQPQDGEQKWTLTFPLGAGDTLEVEVGRKGRDGLAAILAQEEADDAAERPWIDTIHEFDSSLTCNYCGVAAERSRLNEPCPARNGAKP